jgi:cytochrome c oxidase cbb3-type subunit III
MNNKVMQVFFLMGALGVPYTALSASAEQGGEGILDGIWSNPVFLTLLTVAIVLALIIGVLGAIVVHLVKYKLSLKGKGTPMLSVALFGVFLFSGTDVQASSTYAGIHATSFWMLVSVIAVELFLVFWLIMLIYRLFQPEVAAEAATSPEAAKVRPSFFWRLWAKLNDSVEIEKERDVLLDHDYDGIKELDNNLPPWWKYGFYLTIVFAVGYLAWFHVLDGPSSHEELMKSNAKAEAKIAAYMKELGEMVDEDNVVFLSSAEDLADGRRYYETECVNCHGKWGEGGPIAPNLTDEYWLHGGSMREVFTTIKYGVQGKGMIPWKNNFSAKEMAQIASYVISLQGTNPPNAWEPQGVKYVPPTEAEEVDKEGDEADDSDDVPL